MAKVQIGDRQLEVKPATLGFARNVILPWRKRFLEAKEEEQQIDLIVEWFQFYLVEPPAKEWLLDQLPEDSTDLRNQVRAAAGQKPMEPRAGEAPRP